MPKKANVYIDGFNLYYQLKGTPHKWLDPSVLVRAAFPQFDINHIRYFTALVQARPNDPQQPQRQLTYLRALGTIPNLTVYLGTFKSRTVRLPLANPLPGQSRTVKVIKDDEKGSDVNLATYLLLDGFEKDYDVAIVVSNDSDLEEPVKIVRDRLGLQVAILNPQRDNKKTAWPLVNAATPKLFRRIRVGALQKSQFPSMLTDANGTFFKPSTW